MTDLSANYFRFKFVKLTLLAVFRNHTYKGGQPCKNCQFRKSVCGWVVACVRACEKE